MFIFVDYRLVYGCCSNQSLLLIAGDTHTADRVSEGEFFVLYSQFVAAVFLVVALFDFLLRMMMVVMLRRVMRRRRTSKTQYLLHRPTKRRVDDAVQNEVSGEVERLHDVRDDLDRQVRVVASDVGALARRQVGALFHHLRRCDENEEENDDGDERDGDAVVGLLVGVVPTAAQPSAAARTAATSGVGVHDAPQSVRLANLARQSDVAEEKKDERYDVTEYRPGSAVHVLDAFVGLQRYHLEIQALSAVSIQSI